MDSRLELESREVFHFTLPTTTHYNCFLQIVDLDIIDVSNLNRQFLFRNKHVGQSKAKVAREAILKFGPPKAVDTIIAHHGNVKNEKFGLEFFNKFDIVFNALDNVAARRHVNRLCIAKGKPLVESGTAGYIGQASVIKGKVTECYDCQPKATPKQVCSRCCSIIIRSYGCTFNSSSSSSSH